MTARRPFTPPDPPPAPVVERLQVQRATRGVRERGRWWLAWSLAVGGAFGWAWLWGFALAPDVQLLACVALPGFLALGSGLVYFGLPLVDEAARFWLFVAAARQELALRADAVGTALNTVEAHAARWYRAPRRRERVIKVRVGEGLTLNPEPSERPTQQLPALPAPLPYYGTAAYAIVAAALAGQPTGVNTLGRRLGKANHLAAMARLLAAGVMEPGQGRGSGPALAPGFAALGGDPALAHERVAAWLGAPPSPTGDRARAETAP